jgi:hypothetical protein
MREFKAGQNFKYAYDNGNKVLRYNSKSNFIELLTKDGWNYIPLPTHHSLYVIKIKTK